MVSLGKSGRVESKGDKRKSVKLDTAKESLAASTDRHTSTLVQSRLLACSPAREFGDDSSF